MIPFYTTLTGDLYDINKQKALADGSFTFDVQVYIYDMYFESVKGNDVFDNLPPASLNMIRIPPLYYPIYKKN